MQCEYGALLHRKLQEKTEIFRQKSVPVPHFPSQISGLLGDRLENMSALYEDYTHREICASAKRDWELNNDIFLNARRRCVNLFSIS